MEFGAMYINSIQQQYEAVKLLGDRVLLQVTEQQLHVRPNDMSNSIAIILQHLHGDMVSHFSHFLTEDGEKPTRNREKEFQVKAQSFGVLAAMWEHSWLVVFQALQALKPLHLTQPILVAGALYSIFDALHQQLARYSYHIGQMVYIAKWLQHDSWQPLSMPHHHALQLLQPFLTTKMAFDV